MENELVLGEIFVNKNSFNDIIKTEEKRKYYNKPLCSYSFNDWVYYFLNEFKKTYGERCNNSIVSQILILQNDVYPNIFTEKRWSAIDFEKFIIRSFDQTKMKDQRFLLTSFHYNSKAMNYFIDDFNKGLILEREMSLFDKIIYLPFLPISPKQDDLGIIFQVFSKENPVGILYNYGISNYVKFIQLYNKISLDESIKIVKKIILDFIKENKNNRILMCDIFSGIFRNSILWEPVTDEKVRKGKTEDEITINWRNEFSKIIDYFEIKNNDWWQERNQRYGKIIPAVKKLFLKKEIKRL